MIRKAAILCLLAVALAATASAQSDGDGDRDDIPKGVQHFDHVFIIMMENHGYFQVVGNPNEPYLNHLISDGKVSLATNYFAVGHPSLTNYLEVIGGSNFGVRSDNAPLWHDKSCSPNIVTGIVNADDNIAFPPKGVTPGTAPVPVDLGNVCPIAGAGMDAETPAIDSWNEISPEPSGLQFLFLADIDGVRHVSAAKTKGEMIGDQLVQAGLSWKSYQEDLPLSGADGVNFSNGTASNLTDFSTLAPLTMSSVVQAYAVKHNPFAYFQSVQEGTWRGNGLENMSGFEGQHGLFADLARGDVPSLSFIAPSQCNDQHGRGNADAFCAFDFGVANGNGLTIGTTDGLNPGLIQQGDVTIERLVHSIKASPVWHDSSAAIVIVWDENDYSGSATQSSGLFPLPNQNKVVLAVETSRDNQGGVKSATFYNSYSLLKSIEAGFGLPCLNHACDSNVAVMSDLFGTGNHGKK